MNRIKKHVQGRAKEWTLGCVNPASWPLWPRGVSSRNVGPTLLTTPDMLILLYFVDLLNILHESTPVKLCQYHLSFLATLAQTSRFGGLSFASAAIFGVAITKSGSTQFSRPQCIAVSPVAGSQIFLIAGELQ